MKPVAGPKMSARTPVLVGLAMLALLVAGLGGWGAFASIMGAVVASGKVEVQSQRQIIQHADGGVVDRVMVREGDRVRAGQPILRLDGTRLLAELAMADAQYYEVLARGSRLRAERDGDATIRFPGALEAHAAVHAGTAGLIEGQRGLFTARAQTLSGQREQLAERIAQIESQLTGHSAQITALERQAALIAQELADKRSLLARGLAQVPTILALDREAARIEGERGAMIAAAAEARGRIVETRLEIINLTDRRREEASQELRDLDVQELQLAEKRAALGAQIARLEVRAPVAGVVHGLQVPAAQAVLRAADTVAYIVPQDQPLVVVARIAPTDIDSVFPGQPANLRFTTFASRTTPELSGQVTVLSVDAFEDPQTRQSYFRAEIALDPAGLDRLGGAQILPGMPVEVMLTTGARSASSYLLKPVTDYFARAFREG